MNLYQHFRPEERPFIDQVLNWKEYVENSYSVKLTDFLDPREQQIVKIVIGNHPDVKWEFFGGSDGVERKRALLYPSYYEVGNEDFQIKLFELEYAKKFLTIEHRQVLGTLMSLGLKRSKFGDILINEDRVQFFVTDDIANYMNLQLTSIGKAPVSLIETPLQNALFTEEDWKEIGITVSSLRLDAMIASVFNLSRQKSQLLIQQGHVKVNWTMIESTTFVCGEGDVFSVRGQGRAKIMSIEGKTKKDKYRVIAGKKK